MTGYLRYMMDRYRLRTAAVMAAVLLLMTLMLSMNIISSSSNILYTPEYQTVESHGNLEKEAESFEMKPSSVNGKDAQNHRISRGIFGYGELLSYIIIFIPGVLFTFIISALNTSLDSMLRVKLFEESIPISKRRKYLAKALFNSGTAVIFSAAQFVITAAALMISPLREIADYSDIFRDFIYTAVLMVSFSLIFTWLGSLCGNIISHMAVGAFAFGGATLLIISLEAFIGSVLGTGTFLDLSKSDMPSWLNPYSMFTMDFAGNLIMFFINSLILTGIGVLSAEHISAERGGSFFMSKAANRVYFALFVITLSGIVISIFTYTSAVIRIPAAVLIIGAFSFLGRYMFRAKMKS